MKTKKNKSFIRLVIRWGLICALVVLALVSVCNVIVIQSAKGRTYNNVEEIPYNKVGVVLGTVPKLSNGNDNYYYTCRMKATADLYYAGKISYIIASGDNHIKEYNEPECMRNSLVALGVPDTVIYLDYAGFRTFDSMVRAKKVFGQDSITVISQHWHNQRAIFVARQQDMNAIGFDAKDAIVRKAYFKNHLREMLAKVKAVVDVCFGKQPHFLGEPIIIP
ncbi:MAG: ElyC/SanA/YdcF family protein [bacterium]|nr:ElyC/SanA/YdcF family protein [bacterium]